MKRIREDGCSELLLDLSRRIRGWNGSHCGESKNGVQDRVLRKSSVKRVAVLSMDEFMCLDSVIELINVKSNGCNEAELKELDLSRFVNLKILNVEDYCFENVKEVKLIGLKKLERVLIGEYSFRKNDGGIKDGKFYLRDCERLKELRIGCHSFEDYSVCVIENVPSLEVIEMGEMEEKSFNFYEASLELNCMC